MSLCWSAFEVLQIKDAPSVQNCIYALICCLHLQIQAGPAVENVAQFNNPIECLDLHLTEITLNKYRGTNPEIKFTRFFVQKASVLKVIRFALCIVRMREWFADQRRCLQLNEKASREAQFHFGTSYDKLFGSYYVRLLYDFLAANPFAEILLDSDSEEAEF
jgi:hypothetical protein